MIGLMPGVMPTGRKATSVEVTLPEKLAFGNGKSVNVAIAAVPPLRTINLGLLSTSAFPVASSSSSLAFSSQPSWMPPSVSVPFDSMPLPTGGVSGKAEEIALPGMPLGGLASEYQEQAFEVDPGDTILMLTDGLPELTNVDGDPLGYPRVRSLFESLGGKPPAEVIAGMSVARTTSSTSGAEPVGEDLRDLTRVAEKEAILKALERNGFNKSRTADVLKIDRKTLYNKLKTLGIKV